MRPRSLSRLLLVLSSATVARSVDVNPWHSSSLELGGGYDESSWLGTAEDRHHGMVFEEAARYELAIRGEPPKIFVLDAADESSTITEILNRQEGVCAGQRLEGEPASIGKEFRFWSSGHSQKQIEMEFWEYMNRWENCDVDQMKIDGNSRLLGGPHTPKFIKHTYAKLNVSEEELRFVVLLRDPVQRAYAEYQNCVRNGRGCSPVQASNNFEETVARELQDWKKCNAERDFTTTRWQGCGTCDGYSLPGLYAEQLENWFQYFNSSQFLVATEDMLKESPKPLFNAIVDHIGLQDAAVPRFFPKAEAIELPESSTELAQFFDQPNVKLLEMADTYPDVFFKHMPGTKQQFFKLP